MKRILSVIAFVCLLACSSFSSPIPVTGTISLADGTKLNGTVRLTLSVAGARDTTNNNVVVAQSVLFRVQQGSIQSSAQVVPNDVLQPGNTYYVAEYFTASGQRVARQNFYISGQTFDLGSATPTPVTTSNLSFGNFTGLTNVDTSKLNNVQTCQRTGADMGVKIAAAVAASSAGAIVDCRGLQGAQTASSTITISKAVTLLLGPTTLTSSATTVFNVTAANVVIQGNSQNGTVIVSSASSADVIKTNSTLTMVNDLTIRCSGAKTAGAAAHAASGGSFNLNNVSVEPCYNGVQMDASTSGQFYNVTLGASASTSASANWNAQLLIKGDGVTNITDFRWMGGAVSQDRACAAGGCIVIDSGADTILFTGTEFVASGSCLSGVSTCGSMWLVQDTVGASNANSPRFIRCVNCVLETGFNDETVTITSAKDVRFVNSYFSGHPLRALRLNGTSGFPDGVAVQDSLFLQPYREAVRIDGASNVSIIGNRLDAASQLTTNTYSTIYLATNANIGQNFNFSLNQFSGTLFTYTNKPKYYIEVASGAVNSYQIVGNYFNATWRGTADISDGGSSPKLIAGNIGTSQADTWPNDSTFTGAVTVTGAATFSGGFGGTTGALSGQFTSTLATGSAPFVVSSTTPVANLTTGPTGYNTAGTQLTNLHVVTGSAAANGSGTLSVTLTGSAVFTSSGSYICTASNRTGVFAVQTGNSSGSAFTLQTRASADTLDFVCVGN